MDEWTDIIRGSSGNLNGSVDSTDCYTNASDCYNVLQVLLLKELLQFEQQQQKKNEKKKKKGNDERSRIVCVFNRSTSFLSLFNQEHIYCFFILVKCKFKC